RGALYRILAAWQFVPIKAIGAYVQMLYVGRAGESFVLPETHGAGFSVGSIGRRLVDLFDCEGAVFADVFVVAVEHKAVGLAERSQGFVHLLQGAGLRR